MEHNHWLRKLKLLAEQINSLINLTNLRLDFRLKGKRNKLTRFFNKFSHLNQRNQECIIHSHHLQGILSFQHNKYSSGHKMTGASGESMDQWFLQWEEIVRILYRAIHLGGLGRVEIQKLEDLLILLKLATLPQTLASVKLKSQRSPLLISRRREVLAYTRTLKVLWVTSIYSNN